MERIEFSELTNRMHRNLVAVAAAIIVIVFFDIKIDKATTLGMEVTGLTTGVLLWILVAMLLYHMVAFVMRAIEEFRAWELKLASRIATSYGGKIDTIELANQLRGMAEMNEKLQSSRIDANDVALIKQTAEVAQIYAKRFKNFPAITWWRFWLWDIGVAALLALIALGFAAYAFRNHG